MLLSRPYQPSISKLPTRIVGATVTLEANSLALWPRIKKLGKAERAELSEWLKATEDPEVIFTDQARYKRWLDDNNQAEFDLFRRGYWIYSPRDNRLVGTITAHIPQDEDVLTLGCVIFPEYRSRSFASAAASMLADTALKSGLVSYVCAETTPDNAASARCLLKAGFQEVASGLCTTSSALQKTPMRRFIKTNGPLPAEWPLRGYMQPR
jgi:RimJ/RimL family protein N-acetyltransferase